MPNTKALYRQAIQFYEQRDYIKSEGLLRQILDVEPQNAHSLNLMATIGYEVKNLDMAEQLARMAINLNKREADFHHTLGDILSKQGRLEDALKSYQNSVQQNPRHVKSLFSIAYLCRDQGAKFRNTNMLEAALHHFLRILQIKPNEDAYSNAGYVCQQLGRYADAAKLCKECLEHFPNSVKTLSNLGAICDHMQKFQLALDYYHQALKLEPTNADIHANMATALKNAGRIDDAIASFKTALSLDPYKPWIYSNLLFSMVYSASVSPDELASMSRQFGEKIADPLMRKRAFRNTKDLGRRLRIGYVSADFRDHPVSYFLSPVCKHDKDKFEIFAYSKVENEDLVTQRLKQHFDHWRDIKFMDDDAAADLIEKDQIDILVDLSGHTAKNGLMIFARKPAPIQVTWLGYTATTGMKAIDYRFTDPYSDPVGMTEHLNTEELWRLPDIFAAYSPREGAPTAIDHLPFDDNKFITFGCFNNFSKVADATLNTWAKILEGVPNSRIIIEIAGIEDHQLRENIERRLILSGLPMQQVKLEARKRENQFSLYNQIDIALDPFPCVGGTTSMDTLWMGVPFITLSGNQFSSRMGVGILNNVGLSELVANSVDDYIFIALSLAKDTDRLRIMRNGLRERVLQSPIMDQKKFTQNIEAAYEQMWRKWVAEAE